MGLRCKLNAGFPAGTPEEGGSNGERFKVSGQASSIRGMMRRRPLVKVERAEFHLLPAGVQVRHHCALLAVCSNQTDCSEANRAAAIFTQFNEPNEFAFQFSRFCLH